jgi:hypothetical protein
VNLDYVNPNFEDLRSIMGVDEMDMNEMSLGEMLYFALVESFLPDFVGAS